LPRAHLSAQSLGQMLAKRWNKASIHLLEMAFGVDADLIVDALASLLS
jgi:hypothetical protein